jgi:sortase (surface protein transpeptidase)
MRALTRRGILAAVASIVLGLGLAAVDAVSTSVGESTRAPRDPQRAGSALRSSLPTSTDSTAVDWAPPQELAARAGFAVGTLGPPPPPLDADPVSLPASVAAFARDHGEPADATLGRLRIPRLEVDAPIGARIVGDDSVLPNPAGPADAVWYDFAQWPGFGGGIGGGGNAVLAAHVDFVGRVPYAGVKFQGHGIFFNLRRLEPGDVIEIEAGGQRLRYAVIWSRELAAADGAAWTEVLSAGVDLDSITLITCGGEFDSETRSYQSRTVVRAVRGPWLSPTR